MSNVSRMLVAVDGSEGALRALDFGRDLGKAFGARLILLHVIEPFPEGALGNLEPMLSEQYARRMKQATDYLLRWSTTSAFATRSRSSRWAGPAT